MLGSLSTQPGVCISVCISVRCRHMCVCTCENIQQCQHVNQHVVMSVHIYILYITYIYILCMLYVFFIIHIYYTYIIYIVYILYILLSCAYICLQPVILWASHTTIYVSSYRYMRPHRSILKPLNPLCCARPTPFTYADVC
jgi:hypothetical protein